MLKARSNPRWSPHLKYITSARPNSGTKAQDLRGVAIVVIGVACSSTGPSEKVGPFRSRTIFEVDWVFSETKEPKKHARETPFMK